MRQVLVALVIITTAPVAVLAEPVDMPAAYGEVELIRDTWGIPNVFASTDEGAMFGVGWATAEDRAFQMYLNVRSMQGRCAEVRGLVTTTESRQGEMTSVEADVRNRTWGFWRYAQAAVANLDKETRTMLEAYSAGVNAFMAAHPERLSPYFKKTGLRPEPWTPAHCIVTVWNFAFYFTEDGMADLQTLRDYEQQGDLRAQSTKASKAIDYGATVQRADVSDQWVQRCWDYVKAKGVAPERAPQASTPKLSHAWVVGKPLSATGAAILHSDPQMPVYNPAQIYEFHVAGKTFNVRGMGGAGCPWILIGFNANIAWGVTGMGCDMADLFLLKTDADHPNQYQFDGQWRDMKVSKQTVLVRGGDAVTFRLRETHFGPIVTDLVEGVQSGEEVALLRVPFCLTDRATVNSCLPMFRAKDVYELGAATKSWCFPPANMVLGDSQGNIGYRALGLVPLRSKHARWEGRTAQIGWKSEHLWREFVPHDLMPHAFNSKRGYFSSANQRNIASFYPIPSGFTFGGFGGRGRILFERMEALENATPKDVLAVHYDCTNIVKREIVRLGFHVRDVMKATVSADAGKALEQLEPWRDAGYGMDNRVQGTALAKVLPEKFSKQLTKVITSYASDEYRSGGSDLGLWFDMIFARLEENPTAPLTDAERKLIDQLLATGWRNAVEQYGADPSQWNEIARSQYRQRMLGYYTDLAGYPTLDPVMDLPEPDLYNNERLTMLSQRGECYSQNVRLHDPDSSLSLQPIGPSEHPASPYRISTYAMWSRGELHPAPVSRKAVEKIANFRVTLTPK